MKKLLVLGGTQMIGRDFVETAINDNQYEIYIANRGLTNPGLFNCKHIKIDRNNLESCQELNKFDFDIVVDFSCYNENQLRNVLMYLKFKEYYILSTMAVEDEVLLKDPSHYLHKYAIEKKELEEYIQAINLNSVYNITIIRPCIIYGANDYTGRFYEQKSQFYRTSDNSKVVEDRYHIYVKNFSKRMSEIIQASDRGVIEIYGNEIKKNFVLHPNESKYISINRFDLPFRHIVIDNVFNNTVYNDMCKIFPTFIARTVPYKDQPGAANDYEGYISGLSFDELSGGYELFASQHLRNFVEKEFDIKTTKFIAPSAHFHKPPSKDGFIHRDYNIVSFKDDGEKQFVTSGGAFYTDDTIHNPDCTKVLRSIALLYYLNNDDNIGCSGGGTGIYASYKGGHIKTIEPKNNRLFIFEITHNSYHGFIGANFARSCVVSWFHSGPAYMINRHWEKYEKNNGIIERWGRHDAENYWKIESDPEYLNYFTENGEKL